MSRVLCLVPCAEDVCHLPSASLRDGIVISSGPKNAAWEHDRQDTARNVRTVRQSDSQAHVFKPAADADVSEGQATIEVRGESREESR